MAREPTRGWNREKLDPIAQENGFATFLAWVVALEAKQGGPICGTYTNRLGRPCIQTRLNETGRCAVHGAQNPVGPAHPGYRTGAKSKAGLGGGLTKRIEERLRREERLLEQNRHIATLDAIFDRMVELLDDANDRALRPVLAEIAALLDRALRKEDTGALREAYRLAKEVDEEAGRVDFALEELRRTGEARNRLAKTELDRRVKAKEMLDHGEFLGLARWLAEGFLSALDENVDDPEERKAVRKRVSAMTRQLFVPPSSNETDVGRA